MGKEERKQHFRIVDSTIDDLEPLRAEYLRGYHRGIEVQVFGVPDEWIEEHRMLIEYSTLGSGDSYIDTYARGYRHGLEGRTPESPPLSSESSESLLIASVL